MAGSTSTLWPRSPSQPRSKVAWRLVQCSSGEPSFSCQTVAYLAADLAGRVRKIMPCKIGHHANLGISTTRSSLKNCARYGRTAEAVGASGVPRLHSKMAVRADWSWRKAGSGAKRDGMVQLCQLICPDSSDRRSDCAALCGPLFLAHAL